MRFRWPPVSPAAANIQHLPAVERPWGQSIICVDPKKHRFARNGPIQIADLDEIVFECKSSEQLGQIERGNKRALNPSGLRSGHGLVM
jgi:hypothetical protein